LILEQHHQSKPNFTKIVDPKINSKELMGETVAVCGYSICKSSHCFWMLVWNTF